MAKRISHDTIDQWHDYNIHIPTRTLYIGSEECDLDGQESGTDAAMAARVIKNLLVLESLNQEPILILMNNIGGDVNSGLAIYDAIRACKSHVTIRALGSIMSMGSVIFQAADTRVMSENAVQMIHYGTLALDSHAKTTYKIADEYKRIDLWMEQMYMAKIRTKNKSFTIQKLRKILDHDTFLTAAESVKLGLADEVLLP